MRKRSLAPQLILSACLLVLLSAAQAQQPDTSIIRELEMEPPPQEVVVEPTVADTVTQGSEEAPENDPQFIYRWYWEEQDSARPVRTLTEAARKKIRDDDDFWYANYSFTKKKEEKKESYVPLSERSWFQTLLWMVIIGGFGAFLVIYLSGNNISLFRRRTPRLGTEGEGGEEIPQDIFAIRYQQEIDKAIRAGNYRLAVRLLFLRLLKNMAERNVIRYQHDKTNLEYLLQLRSTGYYTDFFRITRHYEYSWYGKFEVGPEAFGVIQDEINRFDNQISGN